MEIPINTERLAIRNIAMADAPFMQLLTNTPGWLEFIGDREINNLQAAENYVRKLIESNDIDYRVVSIKETDELIGIITLIQRDYLNHRDFGFAFLPEFQGNGFAKEASTAVLQAIPSNEPIVFAITMPENSSSIGLLTTLGFAYVGPVNDGGEELLLYEWNNVV